ncbi:hypothetical protein PG991_015507 [Apiospora marii]|uniref:Uncharacterized protein n=1 Tax=Apiospora marii TaxID=335849 RepID=A0ABR1R1X7_9PEZI
MDLQPINNNNLTDMKMKRKRDIAETKKMVLQLARITASLKKRQTRLENESRTLKREQWKLENEISTCHGSQQIQQLLDSTRAHLRNIDNSHNITRQSLREIFAMIKQQYLRIKTIEASENDDGRVAKRRG